jgi:endonuclease/exonuclease/phosphatase family metal-dependent hydrolase
MRLLSYNIHKGVGGRDRRYRIDRVVQVIEEANPDILCLQEVARNSRRSWYHDQPRLLGEYFNAIGHLYQLNVHLKHGGYGNLILSRWPFRLHHQISLRLKSKKPRGAQIVTVSTPEGDLHVVNWHLGLAEKERRWQARHLLDHSLFSESAHLPTIVAGDFNDWRNKLSGVVFADYGFRQVTVPPSRFRSFPAYLALGALDKAFCRGGIFVTHAFVMRTPLAKRASDHLPLVLDFHLESPQTPLGRTSDHSTELVENSRGPS